MQVGPGRKTDSRRAAGCSRVIFSSVGSTYLDRGSIILVRRSSATGSIGLFFGGIVQVSRSGMASVDSEGRLERLVNKSQIRERSGGLSRVVRND